MSKAINWLADQTAGILQTVVNYIVERQGLLKFLFSLLALIVIFAVAAAVIFLAFQVIKLVGKIVVGLVLFLVFRVSEVRDHNPKKRKEYEEKLAKKRAKGEEIAAKKRADYAAKHPEIAAANAAANENADKNESVSVEAIVVDNDNDNVMYKTTDVNEK